MIQVQKKLQRDQYRHPLSSGFIAKYILRHLAKRKPDQKLNIWAKSAVYFVQQNYCWNFSDETTKRHNKKSLMYVSLDLLEM